VEAVNDPPQPNFRRDAMQRHRKGCTMPPLADFAALNVQPQQRRDVYEVLTAVPEGSTVKDLLARCAIPENELRETLRKLDAAGLARRIKSTWRAVPLETTSKPSDAAEPRANSQPPI
jgi:hypothetical protein